MKKLFAILFIIAGFTFATTAATTTIQSSDFGIEQPVDKKPKKKKKKKGEACSSQKASSCCSQKAACSGKASDKK